MELLIKTGIKKVIYSVNNGIIISKISNIKECYVSLGYENMTNGTWG